MDLSFFKKKLIYRSWHRGCKETDLLLGSFALKYLNSFSLSELVEYEKFVTLDDHELYSYLTKRRNIPDKLDRRIFNLIICFIDINFSYFQNQQ